MKTKTKRTQQGDLRALLNLVNRYEVAKTPKRKRAIGAEFTSANEAFFKRWQEDGMAQLLAPLVGCLKGRNGKG